MKFTKEQIKHQEEFVQAISYQKEVATNSYYDAKQYMERIDVSYEIETMKLNEMKKENN